MESDQQIKGVVIITLPPLDNPSLGKTITAFTLTENSPQSHQTHQQPEQLEQNQSLHDHQLPIQSPAEPQIQFSFSGLLLGTPSKLLGFLGISLFALAVYSCVFSNSIQDLRNSNDEQKAQSFIFPLYHKMGIREIFQRDVGVKLGGFLSFDQEKFVQPNDDVMMSPQVVNKLASDNSAAVESSTIFPVRGNVYPDGLYFTYIHVGSPPRPYYLDIDTGSDLTWIQCDAPCTSCAKGAHALYKPTRGSIVPLKDSLCTEVQRNQKAGHCETCKQCDYEIEYADHSSSLGVLARDKVNLMIANGSLITTTAVFGCAYDQQGVLLNTLAKTDGIIGLSRAKVSLPSQLANQGIIKNVVGHCLTSEEGGGGYMFLGDDFVPQWGMAWVPMLDTPSKGFYRTEIVKMTYGSTPLNLGGQDNGVGLVFDSGSSYTYFTKQAYSELITSLQELSDVGLVQDSSDPTLPICWQAKFPIRSIMDVKQFFETLTLRFGSKWWVVSKKLFIPPEGYLIVNSKGNVCLGILDGSKVHDGSTIILGDISLSRKLVVYDNENKKIGWAPSDCVKPRSLKRLPFFEG